MTLPRIIPWRNQYIDALEKLPHYILRCDEKDLPNIPENELLKAKIANYKKLSIEFGTGSGSHIVNRAQLEPETLFVGFELRFKRAFAVAEKAQRELVNNLLICRTKSETADQIFNKKSVDKFYMNFPDPWEKRKWHKNRMIQPETVLQWRELLKDDGIFSFKTDHEDYFKHAVKTFSNNSYKIIKQTEDLYNSEYLTDNIPTEFERLFCSKGKKIFFLEALKQQ